MKPQLEAVKDQMQDMVWSFDSLIYFQDRNLSISRICNQQHLYEVRTCWKVYINCSFENDLEDKNHELLPRPWVRLIHFVEVESWSCYVSQISLNQACLELNSMSYCVRLPWPFNQTSGQLNWQLFLFWVENLETLEKNLQLCHLYLYPLSRLSLVLRNPSPKKMTCNEDKAKTRKLKN